MKKGELFENKENIDVGKLLDAYLGLEEDNRESIRVALERIQNAKGRIGHPENIALDIGIALERLLLANSKGDQLSLAFRLRGAWLIGEGIQDRIATE